MIRVFLDGWTACDDVDDAKHGGTLFDVRGEADLRRLFALHPEARGSETRIRALAGLVGLEGENGTRRLVP